MATKEEEYDAIFDYLKSKRYPSGIPNETWGGGGTTTTTIKNGPWQQVTISVYFFSFVEREFKTDNMPFV